MDQETSGSEQDSSKSVKEAVEQVKQRIIATGKLMKYLQNAKKDLDDKNQQIDSLKSNLTTSIKAMQAADAKNKNQQSEIDTLKKQVSSLQTEISETDLVAGSTQELETQLKAMENERNEKDRLARSKQSYIQQLEAQCEVLRESSNQQIEKAKTSGKQATELKKKKEEVAALKERLSIAEKKVESLTADLDRVQEEKESLDEDMIEMKMNNDMVENELDDLKESLQDMIPRKEFEKHKMGYNNTISNSKKQLEDLKKQITLKDQEITKLKGENLQLKSKVNKRPSKISPQAVNHDLVKRFHKLRAECIYYQRESKRLKVQLKESCMRESLSYGLDDIDDMPDSPTAVDFLEGDNIFELDTSMHPKASQPRSMAALAKDRRESSNSSTSTKSMSPPSPIARRRSTPSQFSLSPILTPTSASDTPRRRKSGTIDPSPITSTTPTSPKARSSSTSLRSSETPVSTIEKVQLRKSGLIPPRPNTNSTSTTTQKPIPKGKSKQSKLMKFVNARNSEKMLNCKPLPVPITPTASSISNTSSKATSAQQAAKAILPSSTASIPTEKAVADKNATSIEKSASVRGTKRPVTQADIEKAMEKAFKKVKPAATMNSKIALMEEHLKTGSMPNLQDITGHLTEFVDEIDELYSTMNSPAEPVNKDPTTVGHPNILQMDLPQGMVQREKICILLVCLLAKHNQSDYKDLVQGIFSRLSTCVNDKAINNKLIRYVRLIAAVGKYNNQPELVRSCIYSIIKSGNKNYNAIVALLNISYIYKECLCNPAIDSLYQESDRQPEKVLLYNTLQACMAHVIQANDTPPYVKSMYVNLIEETGWSDKIEIDSCIESAMSLLDSQRFLDIFQKPEEFKDLRQSIIMSIELCFMIGHAWDYTYDTFIRQQLWPLLSKPVINDVAIELLGKLGSRGVSRNPFQSSKTGVVTLLNKLIQIVEWPQPLPEDQRYIQHTAARSILTIAGSQPQYKKFVNDFYAKQ